jgi:hypothetical protein
MPLFRRWSWLVPPSEVEKGPPMASTIDFMLSGDQAVARDVVLAATALQGFAPQAQNEWPGGGSLRAVVMQTFVPLDAERILLVAGASPALDIAGVSTPPSTKRQRPSSMRW